MDCKGHSGYSMSLVKGDIFSFYRKQKLNNNSSTLIEIVVADDALPQVLCSMYSTDAQGYSIDQNAMSQDNMATMCLEVNYPFSSSKITRHIKARYFF